MPSNSCILFREGLSEPSEVECARQFFPVHRYRAQIPAGSVAIPRYSALPFMDELAADVALLGSRLVNSYEQHLYVANFDYYEDLKDVTFETWFRIQDVPQALRDQPLVVKGRTNSRKFDWSTHMFAKDFAAASRIAYELGKDGLIGSQGVIVRRYVPLETFELSITGLPFTNEWRIFYYRGQRLAHGYYWGLIDDWAPVTAATPDFEANGLPFADQVAQRLVDKIPFVVIDVAKTEAGEWKVVELNDGCQSGLNGTVDAEHLYAALSAAL